jgi:hypothetical protein
MLNLMGFWSLSSQQIPQKTNDFEALSWQEDRAMLGSNPSAWQVLKKGGLGQQLCVAPVCLFYPLEKLKALNPGGLGAEPPL